MSHPALTIEGLTISLRDRHRTQALVRSVDLELKPGEITGLAGESGCGKSLTALALLGLHDPRALSVRYRLARLGTQNLPISDPAAMRAHRGRDLALIFQDPSAALDPVFTVGKQLRRALERLAGKDRGITRARAREQALTALAEVGFQEPDDIANRYPFELSGGMRQLCLIAMARAVRPRVLIADEPTTALDASTQALIVDQLEQLARDRNTAILLITHDLRLLTRHAAAVSIMYHGRVIEETTGRGLFEQPRHPYTQGLRDALPDPQRGQAARGIPGQVPAALERLPGCAFAPRCGRATGPCEQELPLLRSGCDGGFPRVACHHPLDSQG